MNRLVLAFCLPLLLLPAASSFSQPEETPEAEEATTTASEKEDTTVKAKSKAKPSAKSSKQAVEIFIPSEAISEDLSVSFPVDI